MALCENAVLKFKSHLTIYIQFSCSKPCTSLRVESIPFTRKNCCASKFLDLIDIRLLLSGYLTFENNLFYTFNVHNINLVQMYSKFVLSPNKRCFFKLFSAKLVATSLMTLSSVICTVSFFKCLTARFSWAINSDSRPDCSMPIALSKAEFLII